MNTNSIFNGLGTSSRASPFEEDKFRKHLVLLTNRLAFYQIKNNLIACGLLSFEEVHIIDTIVAEPDKILRMVQCIRRQTNAWERFLEVLHDADSTAALARELSEVSKDFNQNETVKSEECWNEIETMLEGMMNSLKLFEVETMPKDVMPPPPHQSNAPMMTNTTINVFCNSSQGLDGNNSSGLSTSTDSFSYFGSSPYNLVQPHSNDSSITIRDVSKSVSTLPRSLASSGSVFQEYSFNSTFSPSAPNVNMYQKQRNFSSGSSISGQNEPVYQNVIGGVNRGIQQHRRKSSDPAPTRRFASTTALQMVDEHRISNHFTSATNLSSSDECQQCAAEPTYSSTRSSASLQALEGIAEHDSFEIESDSSEPSINVVGLTGTIRLKTINGHKRIIVEPSPTPVEAVNSQLQPQTKPSVKKTSKILALFKRNKKTSKC